MKIFRKLLPIVLLLVLFMTLTGCGREKGTKLPVLMYHHFIESGSVAEGVDTVVSTEKLEEQIAALQATGYTAVTAEQLIDFVQNGTALPEKPVYITADDGYTSNLTMMAPILEKYGMCATIFTIGINAGEELSPYTGKPLDPPRFSYEAAKPYIESGILSIQSHTYDMHHRLNDGFTGRDGVLQKKGESRDAYRDALRADFSCAREKLEEGTGMPLQVLAYPYGLYSNISEEIARESGFLITLTTDHGVNYIRENDPDCLYKMKRCYVTEWMSGEDLIEMMEKL